ncbi:relaxase/mobilization nuclease domain-containing protein [Phreatobacter sp.]|uniref:relaxase/mobilization nuclease domain-containing protein n=1 Tax=Phreatobacter sp. TaxID=1966341 RepID=UPI003F71C048
MILKASQRGGPRALAAHLLNTQDNDHITVQELRGFVAADLHGAMAEVTAIARGTRCRQPVFSLSLNPPQGASIPVADLMAAVDRAEELLGLTGQPRAVVIHEKQGRMHAHAVWSRIDAHAMTARNLAFYKSRLNGLSKELYLEHGWALPEGHRENGWKNPLNFTLAEWQQAKRLEMDPREIRQVFQDAWARSDNLPGLRHALEEHGYYLARGDRRGLVATDLNGNVLALARWTGVKTKDVRARLGDGAELPVVADLQAELRKRMTRALRGHLAADRNAKREELRPLKEELRALVADQRAERARLAKGQDARWAAETKERASRFRKGLGAVLDVMSLRVFRIRRQNEREAFAGWMRDRQQRQALYDAQSQERALVHKRIASIEARHRAERKALTQRIATVLRAQREQRNRSRTHGRDHDLDLER